MGLSPRVRGNPHRRSRRPTWNGSIPARAGEPDASGRSPRNRRVYPRACGGTVSWTRHPTPDRGLSPRVRGNLHAGDGVQQLQGSIPARAGEPMSWPPSWPRGTVYPRACGGTLVYAAWSPNADGLSPRVRGNPPRGSASGFSFGSIPARAGEPTTRTFIMASAKVYPRACGGTAWKCCSPSGSIGLSPRVRGNRRGPIPREGGDRSIPARAGEPWPIAQTCTPSGVYPRACGGTRSGKPGSLPLEGLSPRVRGNRFGGL